MHTRRHSREGLTLVEVVIGLTLFTAFASSAFLAIRASAQTYSTESVSARLDFLARKALNEVAEHLRAADYASITPPPAVAPASTPSVDFQGARGFKNGAVVWGAVERLAFEADPVDAQNGVDDDGDGLVDEGRLVWIEDPGAVGERRAVLCSQVSSALEGESAANGIDDNGNGLIDERGFCIEFVGERVLAHITLEQRDAGGRLIRQSSSRTVRPRNTPEE